MKPRLKTPIANRTQALKVSSPKSRDRLRYRLKVLMKVAQLRKEDKAA